MIKVNVKSFLTMAEIIGNGDISLSNDKDTVSGLLDELSHRHGEQFTKRIFSPKTGEVQSYWIVVNKSHRPDLESKLQDGDEVVLYPVWAGG